jgi:hypothetical protein
LTLSGRWCSEASGLGRIAHLWLAHLRLGRYAFGHAVQAQRRPPPPHPTARYRVRNWREYEAGLTRRGDLTLWLDEAAMAGWQAPRRTTPGGQAWYSDAAIELVLTLRLVFHLALRQAEGFTASVLRLLGQELRVPDHTTLSRRSRGFAGRRPKAVPHGPMHLVIDSTGLKLFGQGEWDGRSTAGRAGRGASCIWPWTPTPARSSPAC